MINTNSKNAIDIDQQRFNQPGSLPALDPQQTPYLPGSDAPISTENTKLTHRSIKPVVFDKKTEHETTPESGQKALTPDELKALPDPDFVNHIKTLIDNNQANLLKTIPKSCFFKQNESPVKSILQQSNRVKYDDSNSYLSCRSNLLHYAIEQEKEECLREMTEKLPELMRMRDGENQHPIDLAARKGDVASIKILIDHDPGFFKERFHDCKTPLYIAIEEDHLDCIRYLAENFPETKEQKFKPWMNSSWYPEDHWWPCQPLEALAIRKNNKTSLNTLRYFTTNHPFVFKDVHRVHDLLTSMNHKPDCIEHLLAIKSTQEMLTEDKNYNPFFITTAIHHPGLYKKYRKKSMLRPKPIEKFETDTFKAQLLQLPITRQNKSELLFSDPYWHSTIERLNLIPENKAIQTLRAAKAFLASIDQVGVILYAGVYSNEHSQGKYLTMGDENAGIEIMDALIDLGAKKISLFVKTINHSDTISQIDAERIGMDKFRLLLSENGSISTVTDFKRRDCKVKIINLNQEDKEIELPAVNFSFLPATAQYNLFDNQNKDHTSFIGIRPYAYEKGGEYILTDINSKKRQVTLNAVPLNSPIHSVIKVAPELTNERENNTTRNHTKMDGRKPIKKWLLPETPGSENKKNVTFQEKQLPHIAAVNKLCNLRAEGKVHISVIYGLHRSDNSEYTLNTWVNAIKKQLASGTKNNDQKTVVFAIFPNTEEHIMDSIQKIASLHNTRMINMNDEDAAGQLDKLTHEPIVFSQITTLPKATFNQLVNCSDYPTLTEGANLSSHLISTGHSYLSILPKGNTPIPQDIGDLLEAMKANALSYKLSENLDTKKRKEKEFYDDNSDDDNDYNIDHYYVFYTPRQKLENLYELAKSDKYEEALAFITEIKDDDSLKELQFLWGAMNENQKPQYKPPLTAETLLIRGHQLKQQGKSLGSRGKEALMAAIDPGLDCYVTYLNHCLNPNSTTVNHKKLMQRHINLPINSVVNFAINTFIEHKEMSLKSSKESINQHVSI